MSKPAFLAGAAAVEITPHKPLFLHGYPFVPRISTGVHDPLLASALCLDDGRCPLIFVGCDIVKTSKALTAAARTRIAAGTGLPGTNVLITATHTHSGPVIISMLSNEADPVVPPPDPEYLAQLEDGIVAAATRAWHGRIPTEVALAETTCEGIGGNRHDPNGPRDARVPVLLARAMGGGAPIGLMLSANMHPTVLHEDSKLVSGDFPGLARQYLQQRVLGAECPVVYHMGAAGNQSPRHVTRANTFEEARRLGELLGSAVGNALAGAGFHSQLDLACLRTEVELVPRDFCAPEEAERRLEAAKARLESLRANAAPKTVVRTAECDWFGAEETLVLARAAQDGRLRGALDLVQPAEIQVTAVGGFTFVGWPGEVFVEFGLEVAAHRPHTHIFTLCNGDLQGYLVTAEAVEKSFYESGNAILASPESPRRLVRATIELLDRLPAAR